jgi:protein Tob/BTG
MHVEVSVALNFVISYLYNKLPRRRVDCFGEELEKLLKAKFAGHWYPDMPYKGSAYRCIRATGEQMDPIMEMASTASGLDIEEVKEYLPKDLSIWIDPSEVSYRIGEKGVAKVLHSDKSQPPRVDDDTSSDSSLEHELQSVSFNPEAQSFKPIDSLSSSLGSMSLSTGSSPNGWGPSTSPILMMPQQSLQHSTSPIHLLTRGQGNATFTAATFAQTKFGSTKLKSQAKRPSRLSPTELGMYLKQRPVMPNGQWLSPTQQLSPLSPRDIQQELLEQQQQRLLLLQQQQLQQQIHQQMQQLQQQQSRQSLAPVTSTPSLTSSNPWEPLGLSELYPTTAELLGGLGRSTSPLPSSAAPAPPSSSSSSSSSSLPSPDALLADLNWGSLAAGYPNLQHLLVAN